MENDINKSETGKNIKNLYDEVLHISEQINTVKEKMEKDYPLVESFNKIKKDVDELKKKAAEIEEYKSFANRLSKENEELKHNDDKKTQIKWPLYLSIGVGLAFLLFSGFCVIYLLILTKNVIFNDPVPMLIVGAIIFFIMAVILVFFAYQNMKIFNREEINATKSKI